MTKENMVNPNPTSATDDFPGTNLRSYTFPLRTGTDAKLIIPDDLRLSEVKRLFEFMMTLVIPPGDS